MSILEKFKLCGYRTSLSEETFLALNDSGFLGAASFTEDFNPDVRLSLKDIEGLKKRYACDRVYYGYICHMGINDYDGSTFCEYVVKAYFVLQNHIYTPIKNKNKWYLTEDDMYLTDRIRENIFKNSISRCFCYARDEYNSEVGMLIKSAKNNDRLKVFEVDKLLRKTYNGFLARNKDFKELVDFLDRGKV